MRFIKAYTILPLFCLVLFVSAGMRHNCAYSSEDNIYDFPVYENLCTNTGTFHDTTSDYVRMVHESSFMAATAMNNIAERTPVQYLKVRSGQLVGSRGGYWQSWKKKAGYRLTSGMKSLTYGSSGVCLPYHESVSVLRSEHFSKCYLLALGKFLC